MKKVFAVLASFLVIASACNDKYPIDELPDDTTPPSISFQFLSFSSTKRFVPFGDSLNGEICKGYYFEMTDSTQSVSAGCSGIVTDIKDMAGGAKSLSIRYKSNSIYSFKYSYLRNVMVNVNDNINAGTILGKTGQGGKLYFELIKNNNEVCCPGVFGSPGFNTAIQMARSKHNINFPSDTVGEVCIVQSLPQ